jgi:hypothetical protein
LLRLTTRRLLAVLALLASGATAAQAQRPDSLPKRDTTRKSAADSAAAADSAFLADALKAGQPAAGADTVPVRTGATGATNPRMLPDFSAVADFAGDLSPKGSTQEDGTRVGVREVELAVQAAVDPYFRGDIFLGINDVEGLAIEQAFLTSTSLPWGLEARVGRYLMPFGKQNTTHRHDLHTFEYPWVVQRFFGPEGLKGTGVYGSRVFAPFGFYQELIVTVADRFGEAPEGVTTFEPVNKRLSGLAYTARLRNYWDLTQAANLELSASAITGKVERAATFSTDVGNAAGGPLTGLVARQSVVAADLSWRWHPLQQGLYKSFILQAEVMRQLNGDPERLPGGIQPISYVAPARAYTGGYVFARWQLTRRGYLGARVDQLQDPLAEGRTFRAASALLEFFPSEFSKLVCGYERLEQPGVEDTGTSGTDRILLQAVFSLGPHKPHPF